MQTKRSTRLVWPPSRWEEFAGIWYMTVGIQSMIMPSKEELERGLIETAIPLSELLSKRRTP